LSRTKGSRFEATESYLLLFITRLQVMREVFLDTDKYGLGISAATTIQPEIRGGS